MGYFVSFLTTDGTITDADEVGSNSGTAAFLEWAAGLDESYPELGYLGEHGECFDAEGAQAGEAVARLQADLQRALREKPGNPSADVQEVARRLAGILANEKPPGTVRALSITDGTEGDED